MKTRHVEGERANALAVLKSCRIPLGTDFHTLSRTQVDALLSAADHDRYHKPANANGSRARYYHDMMQRRARRSTTATAKVRGAKDGAK
jgi:hypothetical protein